MGRKKTSRDNLPKTEIDEATIFGSFKLKRMKTSAKASTPLTQLQEQVVAYLGGQEKVDKLQFSISDVIVSRKTGKKLEAMEKVALQKQMGYKPPDFALAMHFLNASPCDTTSKWAEEGVVYLRNRDGQYNLAE